MQPLAQGLGLDGQRLASAIFGAYAALVYVTPILGGLLADRVFGRHRTLVAGGLMMAAGHFLLAYEPAFLLALACLILGTGLFKGNIASQVGGLYGPDDRRRAGAFKIFFLAISAGGILAPLVVGTLGEKAGWHWGFAVAGVGMLAGLGLYLGGIRHLPIDPPPKRLRAAERSPQLTVDEWRRVGALLALVPVLAIAFVINGQIFNAYLVWADRAFDLSFAGTSLPTSWLISLDAVASIAALFGTTMFWRWWSKKRNEPDEMDKILIGSALVIAGTLCLVVAALTTPASGRVGIGWPVAFHLLNALGFAHVMPIGLGLFVRVAPLALNATAVGCYYLAFFFGNALVGWVGGRFEAMNPSAFWLLHTALATAAACGFLLFRQTIWKQLNTANG
jgi:POT family proton-dependent oligopeptide transporter